MIDSCSFGDWILRVKLSLGVKSAPVELRDAVKSHDDTDRFKAIAEWMGIAVGGNNPIESGWRDE